MHHSLEVEETENGDSATIVRITGIITEDMMPELRSMFDRLVNVHKHHPGGLIVDLTALDGMHPRGFWMLRYYDRLLRNDGVAMFVVPSQELREHLNKAPHGHPFRIFTTMEKAQQHL